MSVELGMVCVGEVGVIYRVGDWVWGGEWGWEEGGGE